MKRHIMTILTALCLVCCGAFLLFGLAEPAYAEGDDFAVYSVMIHPKDESIAAAGVYAGLVLDSEHPYYYNGDTGLYGRTAPDGSLTPNAWLDGGVLHLDGYDAGKLYIRVPEAGDTADIVLSGTNFLQNGIYASVYNPNTPSAYPDAYKKTEGSGLRIEGDGRLEITFHAPGNGLNVQTFMGISADSLTIDTTCTAPEADIVISAETLTEAKSSTEDPYGRCNTRSIEGICANTLHFTGTSDLEIDLVQHWLSSDGFSNTSYGTIAIGKARATGNAEFLFDSTGKITINATSFNHRQRVRGIAAQYFENAYASTGSVTIRNTEISMNLTVPQKSDMNPTSASGIVLGKPSAGSGLTIDGAKLNINIDAAYGAIGISMDSHANVDYDTCKIINGSKVVLDVETQDLAKSSGGAYSSSVCYGLLMQAGNFLLDDSRLDIKVRGGSSRALNMDSWGTGHTLTGVTFSGSSAVILDNDPETAVNLVSKKCDTYAAYFDGANEDPLTLTFDFDEGGYFTAAADTLAANEFGRNYYTQQISMDKNVNVVYGDGTALVSGEATADTYNTVRLCPEPTEEALAEGADGSGYFRAYEPVMIYGLISVDTLSLGDVPLPAVGENTEDYDLSGVSVSYSRVGPDVLKWSRITPDAADFTGGFALGAVYRADIPIRTAHRGISYADTLSLTGVPKKWNCQILTYAEYYGDDDTYGTDAYADKRILCITFPKLIIPAKAVTMAGPGGSEQVLDAEYGYLVNGLRAAVGTLGVNGCTAYFDQAAGTLYLKDYQGKDITVNAGETEGELIVELSGSSTLSGTLQNLSAGGYDLTVNADAAASLTVGDVNGCIACSSGNVILSGYADVSVSAISNDTAACGICAGTGKTLSVLGNASLDVLAAVASETDTDASAYGIQADAVNVDTNGSVSVRTAAAHGASNQAVTPATPGLEHPTVVMTRAASYLFQSAGANGAAICGNDGFTNSAYVTCGVMPMSHSILEALDADERSLIEDNDLAYYGYLLPDEGKSIDIYVSNEVSLLPALEVPAYSGTVVFAALEDEGYWPEDDGADFVNAHVTVIPGVEVEIRYDAAEAGNNTVFWKWSISDSNDYNLPVEFGTGSGYDTPTARFTVPDILEMEPIFDEPDMTGEFELPIWIYAFEKQVFRGLYVPEKEPEYSGQPATCGPDGSGATIEYTYDGDGEVSVQWYLFNLADKTWTALDSAPVNALVNGTGLYTVGLSATAGETSPAVSEVRFSMPGTADQFAAYSRTDCNSFRITNFMMNRTDGRVQCVLSKEQWEYNGVCPNVTDIITAVKVDLDGDGVFETTVEGCSLRDRSNDGGSAFAGTKHYRVAKIANTGTPYIAGNFDLDYEIVAAEHDFTVDAEGLEFMIGKDYMPTAGGVLQKFNDIGAYWTDVGPFVSSDEAGITYEYGKDDDDTALVINQYGCMTFDSNVDAGAESKIIVTAPARDLNGDGINEYKATERVCTVTAVRGELEIKSNYNDIHPHFEIKRNGHTETVLLVAAFYDYDGRFIGFDASRDGFELDLSKAAPDDLKIYYGRDDCCGVMLLDPETWEPLCKSYKAGYGVKP